MPSLVSYTMMTPSVPAFSLCTGCYPLVIDACKTYLLGLAAFRAEAADKMEDMEEDWDTDED